MSFVRLDYKKTMDSLSHCLSHWSVALGKASFHILRTFREPCIETHVVKIQDDQPIVREKPGLLPIA